MKVSALFRTTRPWLITALIAIPLNGFASIPPQAEITPEGEETELAATPDEAQELRTLLEQETRPTSLESGIFRQPATLQQGTPKPQDTGPNSSLYQELDEETDQQNFEVQSARAATFSELSGELDSETASE